MGKEDVAAKRHLSDSERFADLFDHEIYGGRGVIDPSRLREADPSETSDGDERRRDLMESWPRKD